MIGQAVDRVRRARVLSGFVSEARAAERRRYVAVSAPSAGGRDEWSAGWSRLFGRDRLGRPRLYVWLGFYRYEARGVATTTADVPALVSVVRSAYARRPGVLHGMVKGTREPFFYGGIEWMRAGHLRGSNMLVFGKRGFGKSAFIKRWLLKFVRQGGLACVLAGKPQQGTGRSGRYGSTEYHAVLGAIPGSVYCGVTGRSAVSVNVLDPRIARGLSGPAESVDGSDDQPIGQESLVLALVRSMDLPEAAPLSTSEANEEGAAVRVAIDRVHAEAQGMDRVPVLADLVVALRAPVETDGLDAAVLRRAGANAASALDSLLRSSVGPFLSRPTSVSLTKDAPLIVFETAMVEDRFLPGVSAVVSGWMQNVWLVDDGRSRLFVTEEGWRALAIPAVARVFQRLPKLARAFALENVFVFHETFDTPGLDTPGNPAASIVRESDVVVMFRTTAEAQREAVRRFGLTEGMESALSDLVENEALFFFEEVDGRRAAVPVQFVRSALDRQVADTFGRLGTSAVRRGA